MSLFLSHSFRKKKKKISDMDDPEIKKIEELILKIKNDDFIKVDREVINVDTFSKITSSQKPSKIIEYENAAEECNRILEKLNEGMYVCDEKPEIHRDVDQSDLSTIINEQSYSVSYNTVFKQNDTKEIFIVCKDSEKIKDILQQLKISNDESKNETENAENNNIKVYQTIQEAINNASPGQSIIVADGKYVESIIIDKTVEIKALNIADKKDEKKVEIIAESGDCITLRANCGHLEGLKIVCDNPGNTFCTRANTGHLELDNCHLVSQSAGCFRVDEEAKTTIKDSELFSTYSSASLMPQSHAVIMDCSFTQPVTDRMRHPAIIIDPDSTCIIIDCTIDSMVNFKPRSKGMLLRCHISTNGRFLKGEGNGINIQESAKPLIKNCKIDNCVEAGVRFDPKSNGVVDNCVITDNTTFGVLALSSDQFLITNSQIEKNKESGLRTVSGSKGDVINTEFKANIKNAVLIENGCEIKMKNCNVVDHVDTPTYAIYVKESQERVKKVTKFSLIESTVSANLSGVMVAGNCEALISKTDIIYNNQYGLIVEKDSKVDINECDISQNGIFQLVSPKPPTNYNPAVRAAPAPNSVPSTAAITARNTKFGPYGLHCIVLYGKSISKFTQNCSFSNDYNEFLNTKIKSIEFDIKLIDKKITAINNDISAGKKDPTLPQQKKQMEERKDRFTKSAKQINDIINNYIVSRDKSKIISEQSIVDWYHKLKVSPFIILEGEARCTIDKGNFKSNISFVEARDTSKLFITNETTFHKDYLSSIKAVNGAQLDVQDGVFKNTKTGILLEGKVSASIRDSNFLNPRGFSVQSSQDGWKLNMQNNKITIGIGHMVTLNGRGEAIITKNVFSGQNDSKDANIIHKSGGSDLAICLTGVPNCIIDQNTFKHLQRGAVEATQSSVRVTNNVLLEMQQFPLFFKNSNIEVVKNIIRNERSKPQNAIHIQDGCSGSISQNEYVSLNPRFLEVVGQSSTIRDTDNNIQKYNQFDQK